MSSFVWSKAVRELNPAQRNAVERCAMMFLVESLRLDDDGILGPMGQRCFVAYAKLRLEQFPVDGQSAMQEAVEAIRRDEWFNIRDTLLKRLAKTL